MLALGSCQKDLFEDQWLDTMVRVYWLKARFQALQVESADDDADGDKDDDDADEDDKDNDDDDADDADV